MMSPSARRTLIRGGTIVTADSAAPGDLLIKGQTIAAAGGRPGRGRCLHRVLP